ncbi:MULTISPECIES: hypothetical protein [Chelativorans]|uniref:hypothetical protein n=1 Tax=Chelativorans TaxID=449972 RepID=UPI001357483D|nr:MULTISPECIES: hypothetical protein [Chelativorans]
MAPQRYDLRQEPDGTWTVIDVFTGWPAMINGQAQISGDVQATGLDMEEADDLVDLMNLQDVRRRGTTGPT